MERETEQQKIDIECIVHDVLKDLWIAVLVGLSFAFLAYIGGKILYHPTYTSSTTLVVSSKDTTNGAYTNMAEAQKLTETFQAVMDSDVLKKKVSEEMGLVHFPGTVQASVVPETNLLTVSLTADRPELAFNLLKNLLRDYPEVGEKVLGEVVLDIYEQPAYPSSPDEFFDGNDLMKKAFLIGAALVIVLLALLSYMKDTIKNEREVSGKLDTTLFDVLYHEKHYRDFMNFLKRNKKRLLVSDTNVSFGYSETIKKICTRLLYLLRKKEAKVVLVTSAGKGEGKSTVAMNLAEGLSERSRKVLLIDGDLKKNGLISCMQLQDETIRSWGRCLDQRKNKEKAVTHPAGFGFQALLNTEEVSNSADLLASDTMRKWIREWKEEMDVIIIDAPAVEAGADAEVLARLSDVSLLVVKQNDVKTQYINDTIDMLNGYGKGLLGCILNDTGRSMGNTSTGYGYDYNYSRYGGYGSYGSYGGYGSYGKYGSYGRYGAYGSYGRKKKHKNPDDL